MPSFASPGVYFEPADIATPQINAVRTDIAAFLGIAQMGPVRQPTAVNTWQQFQTSFGSFLENGFLAYSAKAFFDNGGDKLYVVRVAAPAARANSTGAQPADGSASLVDSVAGFAVGAVVEASQDLVAHATGAQPADRASSIVDSVAGFAEGTVVQVAQGGLNFWRKVVARDAAAKRLTWDRGLDAAVNLASAIACRTQARKDLLISAIDSGSLKVTWASPLGPSFDLTQPIRFASGAAASTAIVYGLDGDPTLRIEAASPGIWGDGIEVTLSVSSPAATVTSGTQPASGKASVVESVSGFPAGSMVRLFQSSVVGFRTVKDTDPTTNLLEWDATLTPEFDITQPISLETVEFGLVVSVNGSPKEIFSGLSLAPAHPRYVGKAVSSAWIQVVNLGGSATLEDRQPDSNTPLLLAGGRDGIAALRTDDFVSAIETLETIDEIGIIAAPDIMVEPTPAVLHSPVPPPSLNPCCGPALDPIAGPPAPFAIEAAPVFSPSSIYRVQKAIVEHCEQMRFRFAILDPPDFGSSELSEIQSWRQRFDTEFAAIYFPWVLVRDPLEPANRVVRRVPPSGHVAGTYAQSDLTIGVHNAPANFSLKWAQGLTADVNANRRGVLNPIGVDCLAVFPGRGLRVYGARTMSSDPAWRFVNVRRLISMIEHALLISLQWCVFEPNSVHLWNAVQSAASSFLESVWRSGGLVGNQATAAFYVKCDASNNTLTTQQNGEFIVEIGVAPVIPAEFIVFRIGRTQDTLEISEL